MCNRLEHQESKVCACADRNPFNPSLSITLLDWKKKQGWWKEETLQTSSIKLHTKGQIISEANFLILNSSKKNEHKTSVLKSVHFKKTVARISILSKFWYFLFWFVLKVPQFWKKWGLQNCLHKMNGLYYPYFIFKLKYFCIHFEL